MCPIELARAMRARGWRNARRQKGEALFGIRFPNGVGVTRIVPVQALVITNLAAAPLADFLTRDAALAAGFDPRPLGAR